MKALIKISAEDDDDDKIIDIDKHRPQFKQLQADKDFQKRLLKASSSIFKNMTNRLSKLKGQLDKQAPDHDKTEFYKKMDDAIRITDVVDIEPFPGYRVISAKSDGRP
jgi:inorganic pyrophosphatase